MGKENKEKPVKARFWRTPLKSILFAISLGALSGCPGQLDLGGQALYMAPITPTPNSSIPPTPAASLSPTPASSTSPTPTSSILPTPTPPLSMDFYTVTYPRNALTGNETVPILLSASDTLNLIVAKSAIDAAVDDPAVSMRAQLKDGQMINVNVAVSFTPTTVTLTVDRESPELKAILKVVINL